MAPIRTAEALQAIRRFMHPTLRTCRKERIPAPSVDSGTEEMRGPIASEDRRALAAFMAVASMAVAGDKGEK